MRPRTIRRAAPAVIAVLAAHLAGCERARAAAGDGVPRTGSEVPALALFDALMESFVREHAVPGAALAVARKGKLVYARGFGWSDPEARTPVAPDALFRIASVSKPLTAVAVLRLVDQGRLRLEDRVFDLLQVPLTTEERARVDPRLRTVTVEQLLQHRGGFDREISFDPMFRPLEIAKATGTPPPATSEAIVRYLWTRPLDFDPGARNAYSNAGYCILGRVIERVSGKAYESFVREEVLARLGITRMRLGRTLVADRAEGEVRYVSAGGGREPAVVGELGKIVPEPYGAWHLEAMDAHGGWIASAPDLVRFATAFDDPERCPILSAASIERMFARPPGLAGHDAGGKPLDSYYARGWMVRPVGARGRNTWHAGLLPGTSTLLVRRHDGLAWAVLFDTDRDPKGETLADAIDPLLHRAADAVARWPE